MGEFRVVEHNERLQNSILQEKVYPTYLEASQKWDELMGKRPRKISASRQKLIMNGMHWLK